MARESDPGAGPTSPIAATTSLSLSARLAASGRGRSGTPRPRVPDRQPLAPPPARRIAPIARADKTRHRPRKTPSAPTRPGPAPQNDDFVGVVADGPVEGAPAR